MLEDESNPSEEALSATISNEMVGLQKSLEEEKEKVDAHWQRLLRLQAEFENANRRASKDLENAHKYGVEKLLLELLPIVDSLERSLEAAPQDKDVLLEGVQLTLNLMHSLLDKFHVQTLNPISQKFDPAFHEAMGMQEVEGVPPGMVVLVIQKGYQLHERVLRPARVMVSRARTAQKVDEQA